MLSPTPLPPPPPRYDLFWDIPHEDRMGRKFDKWHYKTGDQGQRRQLLQLEGAATASSSDGPALGGLAEAGSSSGGMSSGSRGQGGGGGFLGGLVGLSRRLLGYWPREFGGPGGEGIGGGGGGGSAPAASGLGGRRRRAGERMGGRRVWGREGMWW